MFYHNIYFVFDTTKCPDNKETKIIDSNITKYCGSLDYKFWDFSSAKSFINEFYPHFNQFFNAEIKYPIVKCDFFRYLIMYHFGGIYTDLDFICIRNFNTFFSMLQNKQISYFPNNVNTPSIILSEEWLNSSTLTNTLHNGILISLTQKHPFWLKLVHEIHDRFMKDNMTLSCKDDVFYVSGPKKLLRYYEENKQYFSDICILPYYYFCPYISIETDNQQVLYNSPRLDSNKSSRWVFFNINQYNQLNELCPNSFFVCVYLNTGSMWK